MVSYLQFLAMRIIVHYVVVIRYSKLTEKLCMYIKRCTVVSSCPVLRGGYIEFKLFKGKLGSYFQGHTFAQKISEIE